MAKSTRIQRIARIEWVPLKEIQINAAAQRESIPGWVDHLAAKFDPEQMGLPTCNKRADGSFHILDGQHRIAALKVWLGDGWETQYVQCSVYDGLSEKEEAEYFLILNDTRGVVAFTKFRIGVEAGRPDEKAIDLICRNLEISVNRERNGERSTAAVSTMLRIYRNMGAEVLARSLRIMADAYGTAGLEVTPLTGMAQIVSRFDHVDDGRMIERLTGVRLGVAGLLTEAERERQATGAKKVDAMSSAIIKTYNGMKGLPRSEKLPSWWSTDD